MARAAYFAPGVYVEEIPSARQPIAGVGTNTVGFIGIVPDVIHIPQMNPDYDPVLANTMLQYREVLADQKAADALRLPLEAALKSLEAQIAKLETQTETRKAAVEAARKDEDAKQAAVAGLAAGAIDDDTLKANRALAAAQAARVKAASDQQATTTELATATAERDDLKKQLNAANAPPAAAPAPGAGASAAAKLEVEDVTYDPIEPDADLLVRSRLRPYYLAPYRVRVPEFDTKLCTNFSDYTDRFGSYSAFKSTPENPDDDEALWTFKPLYMGHHLLTHAVDGFFRNGGTRCFVARVANFAEWEKVLKAFESIEEVSILAAPGLPKTAEVWDALATYCELDSHQNVFAVLDSPAVVNGDTNDMDISRLQYEDADPQLPRRSTHAAYYFPHIEVVDPAKRLQDSDPARAVAPKYRGRTYVAPSGHVAGIFARTDEERGVHKAPANASVRGAIEVKYYISKPMQEMLNPQGVNCIRLMDGDVTLWGARTAGGERNGEWMYVNVRRFAGFLEASIDRGTQWVVFEPNDPGLWSKIILNITAFLTNVWRSGALFGLTPQEAFYVKCDAELNPPEVRDIGQVVTEIGVSIVRPAEFVVFLITQSTGAQ